MNSIYLHKSKRSSFRKPPFLPSMKCTSIKAGYFKPLSENHRSSINNNYSIASPISCLIYSVIPNTVIRRISFIIFYSLYSKITVRPLSHILNKVFKFKPSITHSNSSPAVPRKRRARRVCGPLYNAIPDSILRCFRKSMSLIVRYKFRASTCFCVANSKLISLNLRFISTVTNTEPSSLTTRRVISFADCSKLSKFLVAYISSFHNVSYCVFYKVHQKIDITNNSKGDIS